MPFGRRSGRSRQARHRACPAPQLCDASFGEWHGHPHHPGAARPRSSVDDRTLYAGFQRHDRQDAEPARSLGYRSRSARLRRDRVGRIGCGGRLPPPRRAVLPDTRRPHRSGGTTRHGRHHRLPHGCARRPCRTVRRLRRNPDRLQLLPQPALPEVSRTGARAVARRAARRGSPDPLLEYRDMSTTAISPQQSNIWWVFLLQGIMAIILGLMFLTAPGETLLAVVTFLGFYWLITGMLALVRVFVDRSVPWVWSLLIGIVGILAGIFVLRHPLIAALTVPTALVIVLGVQGFVMGVLDIIGGFKGGGLGSFILGVINILVGLLLIGSPLAAALAVPLVFGILLLIQGVGLIIWAFRVRV